MARKSVKANDLPDLSKVETSMTHVLEDNRAKFDACTSVREVVETLESILDDNHINTEASRRLVNNVAKKRYVFDALMAIYNSILAGSKLSVIK